MTFAIVFLIVFFFLAVIGLFCAVFYKALKTGNKLHRKLNKWLEEK